jgi:hypothetical protein
MQTAEDKTWRTPVWVLQRKKYKFKCINILCPRPISVECNCIVSNTRALSFRAVKAFMVVLGIVCWKRMSPLACCYTACRNIIAIICYKILTEKLHDDKKAAQSNSFITSLQYWFTPITDIFQTLYINFPSGIRNNLQMFDVATTDSDYLGWRFQGR